MAIEHVTSLDDPRVAVYRNLPDREVAKQGGRFIAEGEHVVRRLLENTIGAAVESVLLAERKVEPVAEAVPAATPTYVVPDPLIHAILGYRFHSGVIACGIRPPAPTLEQVMPPPTSAEPATLLVCPQLLNHENLGSLIRIAAGFGARAMVLGPRSCDPFWRRSIRVSMGTIFRLPVVRSELLEQDLERLRQRWRVQFVATVTDDDARPLPELRRPASDRLALILGPEDQGLDRRWVDLADEKATIPMHLGTDSLNVAVAAAICLYHFTDVATKK